MDKNTIDAARAWLIKQGFVNTAENSYTVNQLADFADAQNAALKAEVERLRELLGLTVQAFNDLERDVKTFAPKYNSWPMADEVIAKATAATGGKE